MVIIKFQKLHGRLRTHDPASEIDHGADSVPAVRFDHGILDTDRVCTDAPVLHSSTGNDAKIRSCHLCRQFTDPFRGEPAVRDNDYPYHLFIPPRQSP